MEDVVYLVFALLGFAGLGQLFCLWNLGKVRTNIALISIVLTLVAFFSSSILRSPVDELWPGTLYALSAAGGIGVFVLAYLIRDKVKFPVLVALGSYSYSIYLLQTLCIQFFDISNNQFTLYVIGLVAVATVIVTSKFTYQLVEIPFISLGKKYRAAGG